MRKGPELMAHAVNLQLNVDGQGMAFPSIEPDSLGHSGRVGNASQHYIEIGTYPCTTVSRRFEN